MSAEKIRFPLIKPLAHNLFDIDAMQVYRRLRRHQHSTYFVGGCIRDMLLAKEPKDFDIVTSARPHQIRKIFSNSRLIGKRFLLVNVFFGAKIVEVTTFRRTPWKNGTPEKSEQLLLNRDNVFGTAQEDAMRRDFTINALLYDPAQRMVVDYVDGIDDLQQGKIRTIGDPYIRFGEDPVRIIRALKLQGRLNFEMVPETMDALKQCAGNLAQSAPNRILLEIEKILRGGSCLPCFETIASTSVFSIIAPDIEEIWQQDESRVLLQHMLTRLDQLPASKRYRLSSALLLTTLCYPLVDWQKNFRNGKVPSDCFCLRKIDSLAQSLNISKRLRHDISRILRLHCCLDKSVKKNRRRLRSMHLPDALDLQYLLMNGDKSKHDINDWRQANAPARHPQNR